MKGSAALWAFARASLMRAQKPAHIGALQLVPPIWTTFPWKMRKAPLLGSAARLTSGTSRSLPGGTPIPFCHGGRPKKTLLPPPLPDQALSAATPPLAVSVRDVPPTPTTLGSDDSYSACVGPFAPCPVTSGFDPASPLE